jgi:hypothetical protein
MSLKTNFIEIDFQGYREYLWKELTDLGNAVLANIDPADFKNLTLTISNDGVTFGITHDKDGGGTGSLRCHVWQYDMRGYINKEEIINRETNHHLANVEPIEPGSLVAFEATMSDNLLMFIWIWNPN